jgi:hypothetical protein
MHKRVRPKKQHPSPSAEAVAPPPANAGGPSAPAAHAARPAAPLGPHRAIATRAREPPRPSHPPFPAQPLPHAPAAPAIPPTQAMDISNPTPCPDSTPFAPLVTMVLPGSQLPLPSSATYTPMEIGSVAARGPRSRPTAR